MEHAALVPPHFSSTQLPSEQKTGKMNTFCICLSPLFLLFRCGRTAWLSWHSDSPGTGSLFRLNTKKKNKRNPGKNCPYLHCLYICANRLALMLRAVQGVQPSSTERKWGQVLGGKAFSSSRNKISPPAEVVLPFGNSFFPIPTVKD